jgi:hypothetical protein
LRFDLKTRVVFALALVIASLNVRAALLVDQSDQAFAQLVEAELDAMRSGHRGVVSQELISRLETAVATTTIKAITSDEATWHPNDRRGTRTHVVSLDTKPRGAARAVPTSAIIYLHTDRVNPQMSLYKQGTFAFYLAVAMDMNQGAYSADYRAQERRATFFKNAWRDALKLPSVGISDRVPTPDYAAAKKAGLITEEHRADFPIIEVEAFLRQKAAVPTPTP